MPPPPINAARKVLVSALRFQFSDCSSTSACMHPSIQTDVHPVGTISSIFTNRWTDFRQSLTDGQTVIDDVVEATDKLSFENRGSKSRSQQS